MLVRGGGWGRKARPSLATRHQLACCVSSCEHARCAATNASNMAVADGRTDGQRMRGLLCSQRGKAKERLPWRQTEASGRQAGARGRMMVEREAASSSTASHVQPQRREQCSARPVQRVLPHSMGVALCTHAQCTTRHGAQHMADKSAGVPALPWLAKLLSAASGARLLASFSSLPPPPALVR